MSCVIYGYGFCITDDTGGIAADETHMANFLINHKESFRKTDAEIVYLDRISKAKKEVLVSENTGKEEKPKRKSTKKNSSNLVEQKAMADEEALPEVLDSETSKNSEKEETPAQEKGMGEEMQKDEEPTNKDTMTADAISTDIEAQSENEPMEQTNPSETDMVYDNSMLTDIMCDIELNYVDTFSEVSKDTGVGAAIAAIMKRETGINFRYFGKSYDFGISYTISFIPDFPWNTKKNENEAVLTEPKIRNICKKYMEELGIDAKPGKQVIEILSINEMEEKREKRKTEHKKKLAAEEKKAEEAAIKKKTKTSRTKKKA